MKFFKSLMVLLLVVVAVALIIMLIMPVRQHVEKSISVNAPAFVVYGYLSKLENFNRWSVWSKGDSTIKNSISGTDGTLGATYNWSGHPELSGEGKIEITSLKINQEIEHQFYFKKPKEMRAHSDFDLKENGGQTLVTWQFDLDTPRPSNIFNLFSSLSTKMGKDFESGLKNLKEIIEKEYPNQKTQNYEVSRMNFPATTFALFRQLVKYEEIPAFYASTLPRLFQVVSAANMTPGIPTGLYFSMDKLNKETDMAVAIPITAGTRLDNDSIKLMDIPGSKAIYTNYYGAYDKTTTAYASMDEYITTNNLKLKTPVIEQYLTDPQSEKDTSRWLTKIIYLVD